MNVINDGMKQFFLNSLQDNDLADKLGPLQDAQKAVTGLTEEKQQRIKE